MDFFLPILIFIFVIISFIVRPVRRRSIWDNTWNTATTNNITVTHRQRVSSRKIALTSAREFLKPYKDAMGELCLVNDNCKINLIINEDGTKKIICVSKTPSRRDIAIATVSNEMRNYYQLPLNYVIDDMFNNICRNFSQVTGYKNIINAFHAGMLEVEETYVEISPNSKQSQQVQTKETTLRIRTDNLLNINTATESELQALPGINVVLAKKIKKYIEKNGQFTSVEDFIQKMKIKDIFAEKIRPVICAIPDNSATGKKSDSIEESPAQNSSESGIDIPETSESSQIPHSQNERIIDL